MEIFPEDKIDPTAGAKEEQYPVERTLGTMGHIRTIAKKRKWQYLNESEMPEGSSTAVSYIRKFYSQPETAAVTHKDGVWAVWSDEGEPTTEAFPEYTAIDEGPGAEFLKSLQARLGVEQKAAEFVKAQTPSEPTKEGSVAALPVAPYRDLAAESEVTARNAAIQRAKDNAAYEAASKTDQEAWAYSTIDVSNYDAMRLRYGARNDAPIVPHPDQDIAAIWLGKGAPTRPAFPFAQPVNGHVTHPVPTSDNNTGSTPPTFPAPVGPTIPAEQLPRPVARAKVSPHVPSAPLNEMGIKFYDLSKEGAYSAEFRAWLLQVSDVLHAEAARIELAKMREKLDLRAKGS
jgi:hypothetical protein